MFIPRNTARQSLQLHHAHPHSLPLLCSLSLRLLLPILLLLSSASPAVAQQQEPVIGLITQAVPSIVNVTSVSSACGVQQGSALTRCNLAGLRGFAALTISGTGFAPSFQNVVTIGGLSCSSNYDLGIANVLRCDLYDGAAPWPIVRAGDGYATPLLPVVVTNSITGVSSLPAFLISISVLPPVTVQSVSGCSDVGATTTACNTSTAVLTISGSGFVPDLPSVYLWTPYWPLAVNSLTSRTSPSPFIFLPDTSTSVLLVANSSIGVRGFPLPNTGTLSIILTHANYIADSALTIGFIPTSSNSAAPAPSALAGNNFTISSISGCPLLADGMTLSCTRPFTLTIEGSVFPNGVSLLIGIGGERCYSVESTQPTLVLCQVQNSLTATPTNATLPVVIFDLFRNYQSPPFYGVQMAPLLPPVLTNISGCVGSGNMTSNCVLATDVLTITGSNFIVDGSTWMVRLGSGGATTALPAGAILDTRTLVLPILTGFPYSLNDLATSTGPVLLWLTHGTMMSNFLSISIAPSTPNISMISSVTCSSLTAFQLTNCNPGASVVQITGTNFVRPLSLSVGGVPCYLALMDFFQVACTLPALVGYTAGAGYDLVLTQGDYPPVTLAGAISYLAVPSITTITSEKCPCPGCVGGFALYCEQGATISLVGSFFSPSEQLTVFISPRPSVVNPTVACLSLTVQSSALLTCQLPSLNSTLLALFSATWNAVQVFDALNNVSSNVLSVGLYRPATYPVVHSVTGCAGGDSTSPWAVVGCVTGSRLTLLGANFSPLSINPAVSVYLFEPNLAVTYSCLTPVIVSSTAITCVLPYLLNDGEEVLLPVRVSISNTYYSNWLPAITYSQGVSPACACSTSAGSDGWRTAFIVTVVLLSSLVLLFVVLWRRGAIAGGWKKEETATSYVRGASGGWDSDREVSMRRTFEMGRNSESAGVELQ